MFTCMTIRAIHLEILSSMDADAFLNPLMRFGACRGLPEYIRSDNGTNFVKENKEIADVIRGWRNEDKVKEMLLRRSIKREFNPPQSITYGRHLGEANSDRKASLARSCGATSTR